MAINTSQQTLFTVCEKIIKSGRKSARDFISINPRIIFFSVYIKATIVDPPELASIMTSLSITSIAPVKAEEVRAPYSHGS